MIPLKCGDYYVQLGANTFYKAEKLHRHIYLIKTDSCRTRLLTSKNWDLIRNRTCPVKTIPDNQILLNIFGEK